MSILWKGLRLNPLLVIFKVRDLPEFDESIEKLNPDIYKLYIEYYPQMEAYDHARCFFLSHKIYTHFIILPDDLIITQNDIDVLLEDAHHYDVIGGWCNVDNTDFKHYACFSFSLPPNPPYTGTTAGYKFRTMQSVENQTGITQVMHQGWAPCVINREVIKQIPFRSSRGCCMDSTFSLDLHENGIKQYVNLAVRTKHLKINDVGGHEILVNKREKRIRLI